MAALDADHVESLDKRTISDVDSEERLDGAKKIKIRDLDTILRREEIMPQRPQCSGPKESKRQACDERGIIIESKHSDIFIREAKCNIPFFQSSEVNDESIVSTRCNLDLNSVDAPSIIGRNPFYPYKKLGQTRAVDASECGSTTGPVEESESLRMWKAMKQNGFMSSSHGGIPAPKPCARQPKKRRDDEPNKTRVEMAKKEHINRFAKIAAPSGLLSGLNPGIINHVRNSKQVHSIIEAIVRSERPDDRAEKRQIDGPSRGNRENIEGIKDIKFDSLALNTSSDNLSNMGQGLSEVSRFVEYSNDPLALKLSSYNAPRSESAIRGSYSLEEEHTVSALSLKGACVALMWLELFEKDLRGRLTALRRSRRRVRNVLHTELPHLISRELSSNKENDQRSKESLDMHVVRWRCLFFQMDRGLHEEGKQLEKMLKEVNEMLFHCQRGLKHFNANGLLMQHGLNEDFRKWKKSDVSEPGHAVRAAAASFYSTCNLIMNAENV